MEYIMAGIATKNDTLVTLVAQTFNFQSELGESRAKSLVYVNDDASHTHKLVTNGVTLYVKPGERQELTGIENYQSLVLGGDAGSVGAYRCVVSTGYLPVNVPPAGGTVVTANLTDGSVLEAKLDPPSSVDVRNAKRVATCIFDATGDATMRTVGAHSIGPTLPDNAVITAAWFETILGFTSGTSTATVALGSPDGVADILAALIVSNAKLVGAGNNATKVLSIATFCTKFTAAQKLIATVAGEDLTAGKLALHVEYEIGA